MTSEVNLLKVLRGQMKLRVEELKAAGADGKQIHEAGLWIKTIGALVELAKHTPDIYILYSTNKFFTMGNDGGLYEVVGLYKTAGEARDVVKMLKPYYPGNYHVANHGYSDGRWEAGLAKRAQDMEAKK